MALLDSKRCELIDFYRFFDGDDTKKIENKVMNETHQLYNKYFNTYKEEYDSEDLNEEGKLFLTLISTKYLVRKNKH